MTLRSNVGAGPNILRRFTQYRWWSRRMWLHAAVINAFTAGLVMMSHSALGQGAHGALLRQAAQIALMHAVGTIACATFMSMGASSAGRVPLFFVHGTVSYSVPIYLSWPTGREPRHRPFC
jgi:uncharacterized membrane protein YgdD (TMEM256/DUF423 family)